MLLRAEPRSDSPLHLADWLEFQLVCGDAWRVTEGNTRSFLESRGLLESVGTSVNSAVLALWRRSKRLKGRYVLESAPGGLRTAQLTPENLPYAALLCVSLADWESDPRTLPAAATYFEQFCEVAFTEFGGPGSRAVHFGWPSRSGRPERFPEAIRWLSDRLNVTMGPGYRNPRRMDGGVDLVSWRALPDGHTMDYRLTQCTIGSDLVNKVRDVDVERWLSWIEFNERPRVCLAVPYELPVRSVEFRELSRMEPLVLDRAKLVELVATENQAAQSVCEEIWRDSI